MKLAYESINLDFGAHFQDRSGAEEESETLLSALTEMLDSVEDDDRTLSPFDTLPETTLLTHPEPRDNSEVSAHAAFRKTKVAKAKNNVFRNNS